MVSCLLTFDEWVGQVRPVMVTGTAWSKITYEYSSIVFASETV